MNLNDLITKLQKKVTEDDLKEVNRYKSDQAKYDPTAETFSDFFKRLKVIAKQAIQDEAGEYGKVANIDPAGANEQQKERCQPRRNQGLPAKTSTVQPVYANVNPTTVPSGDFDGNERKPKTTPQLTNALQTKNFEETCFCCDKFGHRQTKFRQKARDIENGTPRNKGRQQTTDDLPQFHQKMVCQICGYTGQSTKYWSQRHRNTSP